MSKKEPVVIGPAQGVRERKEVLKYVDEKYMELFNIIPAPTHYLFVARQGTEIVGSMGTDFGNEEKLLRLERVYRFDPRRTPFPIVRDTIIEYGRWIATVPGISGALLYVATIHALSKGKMYGLCEHVDDVHKAAMKLGIKFHEVPDAKLVPENIPEIGTTFYATPPFPKFYMVDIQQAQSVMEPKMQHLVSKKRIVFTSN